MPKFPDIRVKIIGEDGNAFSILAAVRRGLKRAEVENSEIDLFVEEATNGDYNHLLKTVTEWVEVY